jgi:hypothetical protein
MTVIEVSALLCGVQVFILVVAWLWRLLRRPKAVEAGARAHCIITPPHLFCNACGAPATALSESRARPFRHHPP